VKGSLAVIFEVPAADFSQFSNFFRVTTSDLVEIFPTFREVDEIILVDLSGRENLRVLRIDDGYY
jgi:hypothetical protein